MTGTPEVLLESFAPGNRRSRLFSALVEEIAAPTATEILPALERIEAWVGKGFHAAGFLSYEAARGLDPNFATRAPEEFPLLWFGIFKELRDVSDSISSCCEDSAYRIGEGSLSLSPTEYRAAVERIREYIAAGDTYQVNFTMRRRFPFSGSTRAFYRDLCRSQRAPYCAYMDVGKYSILSASPELFFSLRDGVLTTRPMKGTAKRGRWPEEDREMIRILRESEKEQAENLMIVDLLRNDMGMVSETGSVRVDSLFDVETLETLHQMTSTITSRLRPGTGVTDIFQALFPCGSITGAPKKRTMEIIAELENSPRNLYTGCIGYLSPGLEGAFSVAIRTVVIDRDRGMAEMGLGSGITWDSSPGAEYRECEAKGVFVGTRMPDFRLLESILFKEGEGYFLLERHLGRLSRSAAYFGFTIDPGLIREALNEKAASLRGSHKVRLLLTRYGSATITAEAVADPSGEPVKTVFADARVDSGNPFLYHKTDNREFYTGALAARPDCGEVIFLNERGEVTEGANSNVVARIGGELVTPPVAGGLLPGVFREELLASGAIREQVITAADVEQAEELYLINSVRKWRKAVL